VTYLLDTDICIYVIKQQPASVVNRIQSVPIEDIGISSITVAELEHGVVKSDRSEENRIALLEFLSPFRILDFGQMAAYEYGIIRSTLEKEGRLIGPMDLLIAAHAVSESVVLVTNNEREFGRVPNLLIENWV
jgi:tRNA(fMet)-specific endonuclease VapC